MTAGRVTWAGSCLPRLRGRPRFFATLPARVRRRRSSDRCLHGRDIIGRYVLRIEPKVKRQSAMDGDGRMDGTQETPPDPYAAAKVADVAAALRANGVWACARRSGTHATHAGEQARSRVPSPERATSARAPTFARSRRSAPSRLRFPFRITHTARGRWTTPARSEAVKARALYTAHSVARAVFFGWNRAVGNRQISSGGDPDPRPKSRKSRQHSARTRGLGMRETKRHPRDARG